MQATACVDGGRAGGTLQLAAWRALGGARSLSWSPGRPPELCRREMPEGKPLPSLGHHHCTAGSLSTSLACSTSTCISCTGR